MRPEMPTFTQIAAALTALYLVIARCMRFRRAQRIASPFKDGGRPLSSMTTPEAFAIMNQLQSLEFPYAMNKARSIALLKAGGIPTMSKLFAVTGQNNNRNAGKRAADTEILLRESQTQARNSERYMNAVARMNYLHARYRRAGKILDADLLHTLGDGAQEIVQIIDKEEWRTLSNAEKCAIGVFHYNLGTDLEIPFTPLKSSKTGWHDGLHFLDELIQWTTMYEREVAEPTTTGDQYVRVYVDSAAKKLGRPLISLLRQVVGFDLDDIMRTSLCIEAPGLILSTVLSAVRSIRKFLLRYLALPRPQALAHQSVAATTNAMGLYNFSHGGFQPWYILPCFSSTWHPSAVLLRLFGARKPGSHGNKFKPMGYDLKTIGPSPQEGRGAEEMSATVNRMKARHFESCAFPSIRNEHSHV
ncbi:hypothetical protein BKA63DRAFT_551572 [Paraphoma chrysanthemicola]|nr:hypothetical protein BKA63DRAFT_551572 [Paraphoma chrysanthemicola]